jgi:hypothetical protein
MRIEVRQSAGECCAAVTALIALDRVAAWLSGGEG